MSHIDQTSGNQHDIVGQTSPATASPTISPDDELLEVSNVHSEAGLSANHTDSHEKDKGSTLEVTHAPSGWSHAIQHDHQISSHLLHEHSQREEERGGHTHTHSERTHEGHRHEQHTHGGHQADRSNHERYAATDITDVIHGDPSHDESHSEHENEGQGHDHHALDEEGDHGHQLSISGTPKSAKP